MIYTNNLTDAFYSDLIEQYGEDELIKIRKSLMMSNISDEEWKEYCFSAESPF